MPLIVVLSIIFFSGTSFSCKPSLEGDTYNFRHIFKHVLDEPLELVFVKNSIPSSTCRSNMACYDYNSGKTVTNLRSLGNGFYETNHTIRNVTKADAGTYKLKYLGLASLIHSQPLFNCTLLVYAISVLTLQDCLDLVDEETEVQCLCKKKEDILDDFELYWVDHSGRVQNNGNPCLSFVATRNESGYTCRGLRSDGVESMPLEYRPNITISANFYESNLINTQESSCTPEEILIAFGNVLFLVTLLIVMLYHCVTREDADSSITSVKYKDLTKEKKHKYLQKYLVDIPETFVNVETKCSDFLIFDSCECVNMRLKTNNMILYCERQTKEFNIVNDSEDSEGYISMGENNS